MMLHRLYESRMHAIEDDQIVELAFRNGQHLSAGTKARSDKQPEGDCGKTDQHATCERDSADRVGGGVVRSGNNESNNPQQQNQDEQ